MAALVRLEQITLLATALAAVSSFAPVTAHSKSFVAPSPSPAMLRQRKMFTVLSACMKTSKSAPSAVISALPARPLAIMLTMSLVEVSPSTLTMLKVFLMSPLRAFCSMAGEIAASVVRKTSMVAMSGCIMPLPLAMPPKRQVLPPRLNSTAISFFFVSVVMMASQASSLPFSESDKTKGSMPAAMGAMSSG